MRIASPAPDLLARFRRDLSALGPMPVRLGLAVSGGPDSLGLLLLAAAAMPGDVEAATVDHRLRPEGLIEALHVEDLCERLACPHRILSLEHPPGPANLQAEARRLRYAALARWAEARGLDAVATAHHADDQAETLLMRLGRGSGVGGLAGIRAVQTVDGLKLLRPLLGWTKAELVHIVADAGIEPVDDPTNRDVRFDRVQHRALLAASPQLDPQRLARSAAACADADAALDWMTERYASERLVLAGGEWRLDPAGLPREIRLRLLRRALLAAQGASEHDGLRSLEPLLATLEAGQVGTLAGIRAAGGPIWRFTLAPPRRAVRA
jgi:tRNA(Ile)-lysidine synthase